MDSRRSSLFAIAAACFCLSASMLPAQDVGPGTLSLNSRWDAVRTHAPREFRAQLQWPLRTLLEGELELNCFVAGQLQTRYTTFETALSENGMTLGIVLPPPVLSREEDNYVVRAHFHGKDRTIFLDEHFLAAPVRWKRTSVVGLIEDRAGTVPAGMVVTDGDAESFFRSLQLDEYLPRPAAFRSEDTRHYISAEQESALLRGWQQSVTHVSPTELPANPLQLLSFDVLLTSTDQLAKLGPGQLESLRLWTLGGGSLAVSVADNVPANLERWLNQIAGGDPEQPLVAVSSKGKVTLLVDTPHALLGFPGVGRSVLVKSPPNVDSAVWRQAMLHLWKIRAGQQDNVAKDGRFQFSVDADWTRHDSYEPLPWDVVFDASATTMTNLLMPEAVQGVPLWLVCGVLAGCLLAVVPGDYFVLGRLRLQRWTWLTMPLIALGCAWFMVRTANSYMGSQDFVQSLTYVDLSAHGEPVRCTQFQLSFPATSRVLNRDYQATLEMDLGEGRSAQPQGPVSERQAPTPNDNSTPAEHSTLEAPALVAPIDITEYFGNVPGAYSLRRHVNQWTPRISRITRFELLDGASDEVPQELIGINSQIDSIQDAASLIEDIRHSHPTAAILCWRNGEEMTLLPPDASPRLLEIVTHVTKQTHRTDRGLFRIVSQISPQGTQITEDLALDTDQFVIVVLDVNRDESQFVAWRRVITSSRPL